MHLMDDSSNSNKSIWSQSFHSICSCINLGEYAINWNALPCIIFIICPEIFSRCLALVQMISFWFKGQKIYFIWFTFYNVAPSRVLCATAIFELTATTEAQAHTQIVRSLPAEYVKSVMHVLTVCDIMCNWCHSLAVLTLAGIWTIQNKNSIAEGNRYSTSHRDWKESKYQTNWKSTMKVRNDVNVCLPCVFSSVELASSKAKLNLSSKQKLCCYRFLICS